MATVSIMFVRADRLLSPSAMTGGRHVVHFGWEEWTPLLLCYDQTNDAVLPEDLTKVDWNISSSRRCVGSFHEDGYHRCPEGMPVNRFDQCSRCASVWMPRQECIFEPACTGDRCDSNICRSEHTVYIAFFGENGKIGMTTSQRLKERGIEQGADAIAPLARLPNRLEGRQAENRISKMLRLPQTMPRRRFVGLLGSDRRRDRVEERFKAFLETLSGRMEMLPTRLDWVDAYPLASLAGRKVCLAETVGAHRGRVLGLKGKFLLYENGPNDVKALDLSDLPGRYLSLIPKRF
ncbi:MAG TPA: DUF2797 domain-containing protein [Methanomassiliicoccales archaeon]|nr:DUF2797 domain-containing protein [Methanomassiliicoccales archaeon]